MNNSNRFSLFFLLLLFVDCTNAEDVAPLFPCTDKLQEAYGVNCHLTFHQDYSRRDAELALMNRIGVNCVRGGAHFFALGFGDGGFHPHMMDSVLMSVKKTGVVMHGNLSIDAFGKKCWENMEGYARYVDYLSDRYNGEIFNWEVINEVDLTFKTDQAAKKYANLLKRIYPVFKKDGRNNNVLISGLAQVRTPFLDSLCMYNAYRFFDIMNIHTYDQPEKLYQHFYALREVMDKYGWEKEVWLGECGMHTAPDTTKANQWSNRDWLIAEQARRLPRIYLIAFAYGINKVYWYETRAEEKNPYDMEHHFGLLHADLTPKPAYYAYKTLIEKCPDKSTRPKLKIVGENYLASWVTPKGKKVWAAWSLAHSPLNIKTGKKAQYYDLYGKKIKDPIKLGPSVIYIENIKDVLLVPRNY